MAKRGDNKREALAAAAAELFWTKGFDATSIADIAARSGVPIGNVYYYYKSKGDLAQAVAEIFVSETQAMVDTISSETDEPRGRLRALIERLQRSLRSRVDHGCPISLCVRDFRREHASACDKAAESFTILIGFIARELGRTGIRPSQGLGMARGVIAEWQGGIALAHALGDAAILQESFRRMDHVLQAAGRN